jgi:hypothetical protein
VGFEFDRFNTLRENWLLTYNISPYGGDQREGAGVENYFFNRLLKPYRVAGAALGVAFPRPLGMIVDRT